MAYEAGPTGYGLARALEAAGVGCVVAAPGKIERPAQDKVKTDQRDAERLLRLLMIDGLHPVRVPAVEEEALRDLVRAREDVRGDLMRARQRLSKLLLRHDIALRGHRQRLDPASPRVAARPGHRRRRADHAVGSPGRDRRARAAPQQLETTISELVPASPYALAVARLRCLRGIDTLSAVGLAAEIGDFDASSVPRS